MATTIACVVALSFFGGAATTTTKATVATSRLARLAIYWFGGHNSEVDE